MRKKWLWIHGWGMSPGVWKADREKLLPEAEHHEVSFAGCRSIADFRRALADRLTEGGPWTLVGWSMGAMLALEALFDERRRKSSRRVIESVIVVAGTLRFISDDRVKGWPLRVVDRMLRQLRSQPEAVLSQFAQTMYGPSETKLYDSSNTIYETTDFSQQGLEEGLRYLIETDLREEWQAYITDTETASGQLRQPSLLWIHGDEDPICPAGAVPVVSVVPASGAGSQVMWTVIMKGAGHVPFLTQKALFYEHLRSYLHEGHD